MKLELKKTLEGELKNLKAACQDKDRLIEALNKQLEAERDEKMQLLEENGHAQEDWISQKQSWRVENEELRRQIDEMIELAKNAEVSQRTQEDRMLAEDNKELNEAYQRAIKDKEVIENENYTLKEELSRLTAGSFRLHARTGSNASSQNEEDVGYASAKNTLDINRPPDLLSKNCKDIPFLVFTLSDSWFILCRCLQRHHHFGDEAPRRARGGEAEEQVPAGAVSEAGQSPQAQRGLLSVSIFRETWPTTSYKHKHLSTSLFWLNTDHQPHTASTSLR